MPGPGQRVKYPRGLLWRMKQIRKSKGKNKRPSGEMSPSRGRGGSGGYGPQPPWGGSKGGRVGKSSGGSVSTRLSKAGPVGKPN